jgi:hypothetical protein
MIAVPPSSRGIANACSGSGSGRFIFLLSRLRVYLVFVSVAQRLPSEVCLALVHFEEHHPGYYCNNYYYTFHHVTNFRCLGSQFFLGKFLGFGPCQVTAKSRLYSYGHNTFVNPGAMDKSLDGSKIINLAVT